PLYDVLLFACMPCSRVDVAPLKYYCPECLRDGRAVLPRMNRPTVCPSNDSARVLSCQELPTSIQCGEAMARRRKEERRASMASRGMVRRWGRFSSRVRHRGVPDRDRVPDPCNASGSAVDVCRDAPAWARRAEQAADGGRG